MRVLILSCNTGGGHNSCAGAIQEAFSERGIPCDIAESIHFVSDKLSKFISWGHVAMYRHAPGLVRLGYDFAEKHPGMMEDETAVYKLLTGGTEHLRSFLEQGQYDTVICCHIFSGLLLRQMLKEHPMPLLTAFVATDYTCSPGAEKSELDLYFIPAAALTEEFVQKGIPRQKLIPSGIPVRKAFYERPCAAQAKQAMGIDPNHTHLLMVCGSMGCGPLQELTRLLRSGMDETMELSVVCGSNENLFQELTAEFGALSNVHIHGFVEDMNTVMDGADLYLTKPGGLSTTEAAAKMLPMVLDDTVAGCETYNLQFFTRIGGAVTASSTQELSRLCLELMGSPERRRQMAAALAASLPRQNAAQTLCEAVCSARKAGEI